MAERAVFIIVEMSANHCGDISLAKRTMAAVSDMK